MRRSRFCINIGIVAVIVLMLSTLSIIPFLLGIIAYGQPQQLLANSNQNNSSTRGTTNKLIIINFDDGWKSQFIYAKPILDQYGFKASFFIVCNYVNSGLLTRMNWQDIAELQKDGMDIESHTMNHKDLTKLSTQNLEFEIGQ